MKYGMTVRGGSDHVIGNNIISRTYQYHYTIPWRSDTHADLINLIHIESSVSLCLIER